VTAVQTKPFAIQSQKWPIVKLFASPHRVSIISSHFDQIMKCPFVQYIRLASSSVTS